MESEKTPPVDRSDAEAGMRWWNTATEEQRRHWMRQAGDTGIAADAWAAYKAAISDSGGAQ
jgi:hypothetical protein